MWRAKLSPPPRSFAVYAAQDDSGAASPFPYVSREVNDVTPSVSEGLVARAREAVDDAPQDEASPIQYVRMN